MTQDIALCLLILAFAVIMFATELLRMDLVALLVMCMLAVTGVVTPPQALAGFSDEAVITVWAMFILSEGLTRSGSGQIVSRRILQLAGRREGPVIATVMLAGGALSAFMPTVGVAALMLPVAVEIARRTEIPASRLLMPLAFAALLGGMTTLIGTPPNLLISGALAAAGERPFTLFDFAPVGLGALAAGTIFMAFAGRRLLPQKDPGLEAHQRSQRNLRTQYGLQDRNFMMRVPDGSVLVGRTLADSRLVSAAGMIVIALERRNKVDALPSRTTVIQGGDRLLVQGRLERFEELRRWSELVIEREAPVLQALVSERIRLVEASVAETSTLAKDLLHHAEFRRRFNANVLAIRRRDLVRRVNLAYVPLRAGDRLLLQGEEEALAALTTTGEFGEIRTITEEELRDTYRMQERLFVVRVPRDSVLGGQTLGRSRLGDAFDFRLLATFREGGLRIMPPPEEIILGGDLLLIQGRPEDLDVMRGLQELQVEDHVSPNLNIFESDRLATLEATLAPQSPLAGKTVNELNFRDRYGLELVAVWRSGKALRTGLDKLALQFGDALLLVGPRQKLALLNDDPDLLVLTPVMLPVTDSSRAPLAALVMAGIVGSVLLGWLTIGVAAVLGATAMVLGRCLTMEQAYRAIEWRAVFLIAGTLPLGTAMAETGTAQYLATQMLAAIGGLGPWAIIAGLYVVTALATLVIPTPALVVLMAPICITASRELGIAPQTSLMAIAMAASSAFATPIAHPANLMVMGPGGYRFGDYVRLGVPLMLIVFAVVMVLLQVFWPID
ncbi:MAG: SLC13 family permease [Gammaproteobacteria bacterium]|nr:SLC13 family permease [Gammaproteobacteria bacterium]